MHDVARAYERFRRQRHPYFRVRPEDLLPGTEKAAQFACAADLINQIKVDIETFMYILFQQLRVPSVRELASKKAIQKVHKFLEHSLPPGAEMVAVKSWYIKLLQDNWGLSREEAAEFLSIL
jgi:hypothetical protein